MVNNDATCLHSIFRVLFNDCSKKHYFGITSCSHSGTKPLHYDSDVKGRAEMLLQNSSCSNLEVVPARTETDPVALTTPPARTLARL